MKRTLIEWGCALMVVFLIATVAFGEIRNLGDPYRVVYTILEANGTPVGSQNVFIKVQKSSNGFWYDFNDDSFKNSSWTNKSILLSEDAVENMYYSVFTPPVAETSAEQYIFVVDNDNETYKDHQTIIVNYQGIGNSSFDYSSNQIIVATNNDKTGYSLSQTFPANFSSLAVDGSGRVTVGSNADKTGYSLTQSFPANFSSLAIDGSGYTTTGKVSAAALANFFDTDSGTTYAGSVAGSVVKETVDNVAGASGTTDWTVGEKEQIRDALGVAGNTTSASGGIINRIDKNTKMIR